MMDFEGRTALVTGGANGIGNAIATMLAAQGAQVTIADLDRQAGEAAAARIGANARFEALDVTDEAGWEAVVAGIVATAGRLDHLVNSAGINPTGTIVDTRYEDWRRTFAVNVDGMFLGCKHAMRAMVEAGSGSIVNVSSPQAFKTAPTLVAYGASKAATINLTQSVALFGADKGVRCNAVMPGAVHSAMTERFLQTLPDYDQGVRDVGAMHPMNRMCRPEEIASAVCFLLGSGAAFMTGAMVPVDGGFLAT